MLNEKADGKMAKAGLIPSPAQQAKAAGIKNLSHVSHLTGVSLQTLSNWHRNKPDLFKLILQGCRAADG